MCRRLFWWIFWVSKLDFGRQFGTFIFDFSLKMKFGRAREISFSVKKLIFENLEQSLLKLSIKPPNFPRNSSLSSGEIIKIKKKLFHTLKQANPVHNSLFRFYCGFELENFYLHCRENRDKRENCENLWEKQNQIDFLHLFPALSVALCKKQKFQSFLFEFSYFEENFEKIDNFFEGNFD